MVALAGDHEFVKRKRRWLTEEFLDMVAIAESTPGPVAVNSATYIGYKLAGVAGAAASTLAVCLPSFAVIYLISLFFDRFLQLTVVANAFKGVQACVIYLILSAGVKMLKNLQRTPFNTAVVAVVLAAMVGCSVLAVSFLICCILLAAQRGAGLRDRAGEERRHKMILLQLFWNFWSSVRCPLAAVTACLAGAGKQCWGHGWLTESEFLSFIAVSESTPGPLAVNMATFIGASQAGLAGSFVATVGVVLPSFVIILLIAAALHSLMKYAGVNAFLAGVRPCVVAMILATACTMGLSTLGGFTTVSGGFAPDVRALAVFALLGGLHFAYKKKTQKAPSPIG